MKYFIRNKALTLAVAFTIAFDNVNDAIKRRTTRLSAVWKIKRLKKEINV